MNNPSEDPLDWIESELAALDASGLRRTQRIRHGPQAAGINIDGRHYLNFGSNDYLNLAADSRLVEAAVQAARDAGWGSGASPLINGRSELHARLEDELAKFEGTESALVFPSGFAANAGAIAALAGREDAVFADEKNHASLIDGCRLSRAQVHVYRHGDCRHLESLLADHAPQVRRRLIVTDTLFSMDGDFAPLAGLVELRGRFACMLMVDEAHATGVLGEQGRGLAEAMGVEDQIDVRVGTLSKALGCAGGFVCGSRALIDWLYNRARPYVFSTAHPPAGAAAALAALEIVRTEPQRRERLQALAAYVAARLKQDDWDTGESAAHIIGVRIGDTDRTMQLAKSLSDQGIFVPGIRPPSVPIGESLLRISLSCAHDEASVAQLLEALAAARRSI